MFNSSKSTFWSTILRRWQRKALAFTRGDTIRQLDRLGRTQPWWMAIIQGPVKILRHSRLFRTSHRLHSIKSRQETLIFGDSAQSRWKSRLVCGTDLIRTLKAWLEAMQSLCLLIGDHSRAKMLFQSVRAVCAHDMAYGKSSKIQHHIDCRSCGCRLHFSW